MLKEFFIFYKVVNFLIVVFLEVFTLISVAKTDYLALKERVDKDIEEARAKGAGIHKK